MIFSSGICPRLTTHVTCIYANMFNNQTVPYIFVKMCVYDKQISLFIKRLFQSFRIYNTLVYKACYFLGTGSTGHGVALFVEVSALEMLRMGAGWDDGMVKLMVGGGRRGCHFHLHMGDKTT